MEVETTTDSSNPTDSPTDDPSNSPTVTQDSTASTTDVTNTSDNPGNPTEVPYSTSTETTSSTTIDPVTDSTASSIASTNEVDQSTTGKQNIISLAFDKMLLAFSYLCRKTVRTDTTDARFYHWHVTWHGFSNRNISVSAYLFL